jgi:hypothetical protein
VCNKDIKKIRREDARASKFSPKIPVSLAVKKIGRKDAREVCLVTR